MTAQLAAAALLLICWLACAAEAARVRRERR